MVNRNPGVSTSGKRQDNQFEQANELLNREPVKCMPKLVLDVPDKTNFYDIKVDDFKLLDYKYVTPQLKFDLAI